MASRPPDDGPAIAAASHPCSSPRSSANTPDTRDTSQFIADWFVTNLSTDVGRDRLLPVPDQVSSVTPAPNSAVGVPNEHRRSS